MDPLSIISLACAGVQFLDFSLGLFKDYKEVRGQGQLVTLEAFEKTTRDLVNLQIKLKDLCGW